MKPVRVGLSGFGGAGMAQLERLRAIPGAPVRAVFDPRPAGLDRARAQGAGGVLTGDFDAFLASDIEAVSICSPNDAHADQVVRSLRAGKHVICEKPLVASIEECKDVLRAERAARPRVLAVQHQMRFVPLFERARDAVRSGELGRVSYLEGYYVHNVIRRISQHDPWVLETSPPPLLLSGCHLVDLMRWILDDEVEEAVGMGNRLAFPEYGESDLSVVLLRFRSGASGKVVTAFAAGRPQDHSLRIVGDRRCIDNNMVLERSGFVRYLSRPLLHHGLEPPTWRGRIGALRRDLRDHLRPWLAHRVFEALRSAYGRSEAYGMNAYPMRLYEHAHAVKRCLEDFVACIRNGTQPRTTAADACRTVATCLAGVEAYRTGTQVRVGEHGFDDADARAAARPAAASRARAETL